MLKDIGISTESFYKFVTTLSLFGFIYCLSYDDLFLTPHNKLMSENNLQVAQWDASKTYFSNLSNDLILSLDDSVKKNYKLERVIYANDTTYYGKYLNASLLVGKNKSTVDSINKINREFDILNLKMKILTVSSQSASKRIKTKRWVSIVLGIAFGISLTACMILWFRNRKEIDK